MTLDRLPTDSDFVRLFDPSTAKRARAEGELRLRELTGGQVEQLREKCKADLFFLANGPLEYDLLSENLHGHYAKWLHRTRGMQHRMTLFPRGHYKSTINTIAESVQMALPNLAGLTAHPWTLGPDIKLLIGHENRESASRFLFEIIAAFTAKPLMCALFPELIPQARKQRMNKFELELPRTKHHKEPTFDTIGAGGAAQGRHYNWLKLDDLVGEEARDSETVMHRVIMWFDNVNSLLSRLSLDGWDLIGTRWSMADVYGHAERVYGVNKAVSVFNAYRPEQVAKLQDGVLAAYVRGAEESGLPIFPEEFTSEKLAVLKKNKVVWAAQYANNPLDSGLTTFEPGWLKRYYVMGRKLVVFLGEKGTYEVETRDLDRVILVDPSMGESEVADETGIVVTGTDTYGRVFVLETIKERLKPPQIIDKLFELNSKWQPRCISIEEVNFSGVFKYWLQERSLKIGQYLSIEPYKPGSKRTKYARIRGLTNYFASGQVFVLEGQTELIEEYEAFPVGTSEHLLDALAQGQEMWSFEAVQHAEDHEKAVETVMQERDALTGY